MILESVLDVCKEADPEGIYELETEPLSYNVKSLLLEDEQKEHRMFLRLHVMPSASGQTVGRSCQQMLHTSEASLTAFLSGCIRRIWSTFSKLWYSDIYHVDSYAAQYSPACCNLCSKGWCGKRSTSSFSKRN